MQHNEVEEFRAEMQELLNYRHEKDTLEAKLKEVNKDLQEQDLWCAQWLLEHNVKSLDLEGLGKCAYAQTVYPTVKDQEALFASLRAMDAASLIKETVHPQTLKAFVKERLEQNLPLPDGVETFTKQHIRFTGGK